MNKYMNYIILAANAIVSISSAIVLGIFLHGFKYADGNIAQVYNDLKWTVSIPIVFTLMGCGLIGLYVYLLKKFMKENTTPINPKLLEGFKWACGASILNFVAPFVLTITAIFMYDRTPTEIMLWVGFGLSALISMAIIGFTTYLNVGINFSILSREELKRISEEENSKFSQPHDDDNEPRVRKDSNAKSSKSKNKPKEEASAGDF